MTIFIRALENPDKRASLTAEVSRFRNGEASNCIFHVDVNDFEAVPGKPFAYWCSKSVFEAFSAIPGLERVGTTARQGMATADDARFVRTWWESTSSSVSWFPFAKGGAYSPFFGDIYLRVKWFDDGREIRNFFDPKTGKQLSRPQNAEHFFRPGITWSLRTKSPLSMRILPAGCAFSHKGPGIFVEDDDPRSILALLGICSSKHFRELVKVQLAAADAQLGGAAHSFEVGVIQRTPVPPIDVETRDRLAVVVGELWRLLRTRKTADETSISFLLPPQLLQSRMSVNVHVPEERLAASQALVDQMVGALYGFDLGDLEIEKTEVQASDAGEDGDEDDGDDTDPRAEEAVPCWAVGVAFGRFDLKLATGERAAPPDPQPFDPLPSKSPGMLPDGEAPFHANAGILVDDAGHPHDLARLMEEVLSLVDVAVPGDLRRWLQKDFFPFHLQRYSKSRRKAPIYWPISTASGGYTLWIYYPRLTSQTLYTAINDFLDGPNGKLNEVGALITTLRNKGSGRTRDDEKRFEALLALELELIELRDSLLKLAPSYKPNLNDGVQISAAPLWPLFRHKPWQKVLKETWAKLEMGEYDWAYLAMNYWPDRVREKCKSDKSLAIAHGLEHLYVEPDDHPKKTRGRKKTGGED